MNRPAENRIIITEESRYLREQNELTHTVLVGDYKTAKKKDLSAYDVLPLDLQKTQNACRSRAILNNKWL